MKTIYQFYRISLLRLPDSLHPFARESAKKENISLNQLVTLTSAEKISALETEEYLKKRAAQGDEARFASAMSKVADVDPPENEESRRAGWRWIRPGTKTKKPNRTCQH